MIGGGAPVTIQSMTNTDTRDAEATTAQILRLAEAGCEIVRVSVYDMDCARALRTIRDAIPIPLVADIHFDYRLAVAAVENGADKLRINPGNIGGRERVAAVAAAAKAYGAPIRIGVNGGSLEDDLRARYGVSPTAMVESALRHASILEREGFYDIVISLKASNVPDTVAACRELARRTDYPQHIGITEAGMGELALVKSAMGLGALLLDGIGDTLRVSLTGDPVQEVHAAMAILRAAGLRRTGLEIVSCPTCGRTGTDLEAVVREIRERVKGDGPYRKLAVMGCAVNGPGEAREADMGVAFGKNGCAVYFEHGEQCASGSHREMIERLIEAANRG